MYKWILKISEYWTKGNIIGWPDICQSNWPKIFPFVQYSLFLQYSLIHDLALSAQSRTLYQRLRATLPRSLVRKLKYPNRGISNVSLLNSSVIYMATATAIAAANVLRAFAICRGKSRWQKRQKLSLKSAYFGPISGLIWAKLWDF